MVESQLPKLLVAGSIPVSRSSFLTAEPVQLSSHVQPIEPGTPRSLMGRSPESQLILTMAFVAVVAIIGFFLVAHFRRRFRRRAARRRSGRRHLQT